MIEEKLCEFIDQILENLDAQAKVFDESDEVVEAPVVAQNLRRIAAEIALPYQALYTKLVEDMARDYGHDIKLEGESGLSRKLLQEKAKKRAKNQQRRMRKHQKQRDAARGKVS